MKQITRKEFLRLSAAVATSLAASCSSSERSDLAASPSVRASATNSLLIRNADLLTMDPNLGEMSEMDVLVRDDKIIDIGKNLQISDAEEIDANGKILMPGMIDGHRHIWEFIDLGRLVKSSPTIYSTNYLRWKMATVVAMTPEDHYIAELAGGLHAINSGVTSVLDYAHGQDTEEKAMAAARGVIDSGIAGWFAFQLGLSYPFGVGETVSLDQYASQLPTKPSESQWETAAKLHRELFSDESAPMQFSLAPLSRAGSRITQIKEEWGRARSTGVRLLASHMHKPEFPEPAGVMGHRDSGVPDLHEAGLLGPDYHVSHANRLTAQELQMLRDTGGMICATTMGEFPYMMQSFRGPSVHSRARAAGVPTGIGIDVPIALPGEYFEHVRASLWNHYLDADSRSLVKDYSSADTLDFVTTMGASAIRLGDRVGSITVGKRADLVLLDTDRIGFGMAGSLADRVVTFANTSDINSVWIAGVARKRHGQMLDVDWPNLKSQLVEAQNRVHRLADTIKYI